LCARVHVDEQRLRDLWESGESVADIAADLGIATFTLNTLRHRLGLPARTAQTRAKARRDYKDPTPSQIVERSAAIRAGWSEDVRMRRLVCKQPRHYEFPVVRVCDIGGLDS